MGAVARSVHIADSRSIYAGAHRQVGSCVSRDVSERKALTGVATSCRSAIAPIRANLALLSVELVENQWNGFAPTAPLGGRSASVCTNAYFIHLLRKGNASCAYTYIADCL